MTIFQIFHWAKAFVSSDLKRIQLWCYPNRLLYVLMGGLKVLLKNKRLELFYVLPLRRVNEKKKTLLKAYDWFVRVNYNWIFDGENRIFKIKTIMKTR